MWLDSLMGGRRRGWFLVGVVCVLLAACTRSDDDASDSEGEDESSLAAGPSGKRKRESTGDESGSPLAGELVTRIAFGSCNDTTQPAPIWKAIVAQRPDVWVWLGDIVYADPVDPSEPAGATNADHMRELYRGLKGHAGYRALRARGTRILGTWDDHDYGKDDGGKDNPLKEIAQKLLLEFLDEPPESPRWDRKGVYGAYDLGTRDRRVRLILLDTRYHRDLLSNPSGDILGDAQWRWLADQLEKPAELLLLGSSIQVVSDEHDRERWGHFPSAHERLYRMLARAETRALVILSGDRHFGELSIRDNPYGGPGLVELTSSSLTRAVGSMPNEKNPHRRGEIYFRENFGLLAVDWHAGLVSLQLRGADGRIALEHTLPLSPVVPRARRAIEVKGLEPP